jgi:epidermal growth factor receptor substrate 15
MSINTICSDKPIPTSASSGHFTNLTNSNVDDIFGSTLSAQPTPAAASTTTSRPTTSATTKAATFDDLDDDFEGLEDAKEGSADDDFANISRSGLDDFNPVFDSSPPPSQHKNDSTQGPVFGTEASFDFGSLSGTSAAGSTAGPVPPTSSGTGAGKPASQQGAEAHDWDALFAGLDSATTPTATGSSLTLATSAGNATTGNGDANAANVSANATGGEGEGEGEAGGRPAGPGRALTEGGEHDDPILKNLTGMGYSRKEALAALEKYDYNLERVSSSLGGATSASAAAAAGARGVRKKGMWVG